ncbi:monovalent cation/H+ antiporter complex subunit F [Alteromonas ponticola]|uniref:Monovalent cation/H+ antiporter complex subunit F n=1 Tax=Alteromonas aquimaris TaxID=2998417 RepID=A0ABT3P9R3_9ALTE|nr:MrpF/PhaF family protein [Alteromonas aquimaris]MCW8109527.1 monovalent cation/H+ antiporter complex subunit F [Alteromonas aquimaris]
MTIFLYVIGFSILVTMALALARALAGPTVFDRILAVNMFGTKAVLLVAVVAFISGRTDVLDIALLYSLLNFVGVAAALRLVERGSFYATERVHVKTKPGEKL